MTWQEELEELRIRHNSSRFGDEKRELGNQMFELIVLHKDEITDDEIKNAMAYVSVTPEILLWIFTKLKNI